MKIRQVILFSLIVGLSMTNCTKKATPVAHAEMRIGSPSVGAPCIVYKTRSDYDKLVPVILSADRTTLVSYPGVKDIYYNGKLSYPVKLNDGYLLDNRGISPGVAFLNYTYDEYSRLPATPSAGELWNRILDKDPLLEMYDLGNRSKFSDPEKQINEIITAGKLKTYRRLK